jgi:hypothetical protein
MRSDGYQLSFRNVPRSSSSNSTPSVGDRERRRSIAHGEPSTHFAGPDSHDVVKQALVVDAVSTRLAAA